MFTWQSKIVKPKGAQPDELEESVARALFDLEHNQTELSADLQHLHIVAAKEIDVAGPTQKAIVIWVPHPLLRNFQRIQTNLVSQLEKQFSGKHVLIVGQRRILPKPKRGTRQKQLRPRSRTLTNVHQKILEDIVYPIEIVGKRLRFRREGPQLQKIHLDIKEQPNYDHKLPTFRSVYQKLTGKEAVFEFVAQ